MPSKIYVSILNNPHSEPANKSSSRQLVLDSFSLVSERSQLGLGNDQSGNLGTILQCPESIRKAPIDIWIPITEGDKVRSDIRIHVAGFYRSRELHIL